MKPPLRSLARWLFCVALASAASAACRLTTSGPSAVAQGRYFSTGNPNYDEFFVRLHRMQLELGAAPQTLASIRSELARGLALEPAANNDDVRAALTNKTTELRARGVTLALDRGREPNARARLAVTGTPAEADRALVKTFEGSVTRLVELRERSGVWQRELEWLPPAGVALDGSVEAAFVGESRGTRDEVHENLADAQKVIALMTARKREVDASGAELEAVFVSAFGERTREAPPPPEEKEKPKPRPVPRSAAAAPTPPPSETTPAATKPKQGTARPDFEP